MAQIKGVLNVSQIGMTDQYLTFDEDKKYQVCKRVIEEALKNMTVRASMDERKKVMFAILENSISLYEALEKYEECQLLVDLKEVLTNQF